MAPIRGAGDVRAAERPAQGWKVHVSACADNAERIAAQVWSYCVDRVIPFKFISSPRWFLLRNSKNADRASSGKFATLYPRDVTELRAVLEELGARLGGEPGPYILSDLRWGEGPLYVRYGGFTHRVCADAHGNAVPAIEDPDGELVPDVRQPVFSPPEWVPLPDFLAPHLAARNAVTVADLPHRIDRALHFSNGGGVYAGHDPRSGDQVVLKEARPHAGLGADGSDAVARLEREHAALTALSATGVAPRPRDWLVVGEHRFLVMDHVPGEPLNSLVVQRHPLLTARVDPDDVAAYTRWALRVHDRMTHAVAAAHESGVILNDLHMFNVLVAPDDRVTLLDFETATFRGEDRRSRLAHPGFVAPLDRRGVEVDHYALACLRLALFLPVTTLFGIDQDKAAHIADIVAERFPDVPRPVLDDAVDTIRGRTRSATVRRHSYLPVRPADWPHSRDAMAAAIRASATPEREDRLFPGDIFQFAPGGGLNLAHGAAGVLYALAEAGAARYADGEDWLLRHTMSPAADIPPGCYDGLCGIAYVLDRLGHPDHAQALIQRVVDADWRHLGPDLHGGLAGIGLTLEYFSRRRGEPRLRDYALTAARLLADRPDSAESAVGLLRGAAGPALMFLRLHAATGEPGLLELAARALHRDLGRCIRNRRGVLVADEGWRTLPYLGAGSVGIAMVLDEYLAHRCEDRFEEARRAILPAARAVYYAQPGLFRGRAGTLLHLARTTTPCPDREPALAEQIAALSWHAVNYRGNLAFPGEQLLRLSMDLATGTAGCLLGLGAALHHQPVGLPFLPSPSHRGGATPIGTATPSGQRIRYADRAPAVSSAGE